MIIIATLAEATDNIKRGRGVGTMHSKELLLAVDTWNIVLAIRSNKGPCIGKQFWGRLSHMEPTLKKLDIDVVQATSIIAASLRHAFDCPSTEQTTLSEMDKEFNISARDRTGALLLYPILMQKFFGVTETEEDSVTGDRFIPSPPNSKPINKMVAI